MEIVMPTAAKTGFFSRTPPGLKTSRKSGARPVLVNVGGAGDCGFRAIAAGIVNKVLVENQNSPELRALLQRHYQYFPQHRIPVRLPTGPEGVRYILDPRATAFNNHSLQLNNRAMAELIQTLAYTIRQMAVDEMVAHPEKYRGAFIGPENESMPTSVEAMRLAGTWIDETAIAAAAVATQFPIDVRVVAPGKEVPLCLHYGVQNSRQTPITIQLQNQHYIAQVNDPARFEKITSVAANTVYPQKIKQTDPELKEVLTKIAKEDERLLKTFEDVKGRLTAAVAAGEVSREQLLTIYISGLNQSDYLQGYVGIEHGNQKFFADLKANTSDLDIIRMQYDSQEDQITQQLVHAIARAVSINHLDPAEVFDKIEQDQESPAYK
jgi:hypothetical protein